MKIKYTKDYLEEVHQKFPDLDILEINKILLHGFKMFYALNNFGADVLLRDNKTLKFLMLTGRLYNRFDLYYKYSLIKYAIKYRIQSKRRKEEWDGYYYVGMTDEMYRFYESQEDSKTKILENIMLFRLYEELKTHNQYKHYFKIKYPDYSGYKFFLENYETDDIELL